VFGVTSPTSRYFAGFRLALGGYLVFHFVSLVPYAGELFSASGMLSDAARLPSAGFFPNPLANAGAAVATGFVVALAVLSLLLLAGVYRRWVAIPLWFGWACLFNRNPFIANPSIPYVGFLLLACAIIPNESLYRPPLPPADRDWSIPRPLYLGAWLLLGIGYTLSGLHKLGSPSWRDGTALRHVLELPLARDTPLRTWLLSLPDWAFSGMTYGALAAELSALPLFLFRATRRYAWAGLIGMQLGILCLLGFADLTAGMLLFHAFLLEPGVFSTPPIAERISGVFRRASAPG
jgi:hypothetical protein